MKTLSSLAVALPLLVACSSSSGSGEPTVTNGGNGVDDVKQACVLRAAWTRPTTAECLQCRTGAAATPCTCDSDPDRGACLSQAQAKGAEPDCTTAVASCVDACAAGDCTCIDGCYAGHDACRKVAAAVDGCVEAVCDPHCK